VKGDGRVSTVVRNGKIEANQAAGISVSIDLQLDEANSQNRDMPAILHPEY
jgi:hypothetical protein